MPITRVVLSLIFKPRLCIETRWYPQYIHRLVQFFHGGIVTSVCSHPLLFAIWMYFLECKTDVVERNDRSYAIKGEFRTVS